MDSRDGTHGTLQRALETTAGLLRRYPPLAASERERGGEREREREREASC